MIGETFHLLTVVNGPVSDRHGRAWICKCDCGVDRLVTESKLKSGHTKSCGCLQRKQLVARQTKHGRYYEDEFRAWSNMKKRCSDPRFARWYGGVSVCDRWLASYDDFLSDVGRRPSPKHSLDRIDPKGNYEPGNTRWVLHNVQTRNTRNHCTNKTGVRGVSWSASKNKWRAAIYVDNKQKHVGYFHTLEDAAAARKQAEERYWNG